MSKFVCVTEGLAYFFKNWNMCQSCSLVILVNIQSKNIALYLDYTSFDSRYPCMIWTISFLRGNEDAVMWKKHRPWRPSIKKYVFRFLFIFGITFRYFCAVIYFMYMSCARPDYRLWSAENISSKQQQVNSGYKQIGGDNRIPVPQTDWVP